jgi:hypothetical protein
MKQFLFCLLLLTAQLLSAQSRVTVGLIGGIGQTVACKDCMYASTQAQSFGTEAQFRLVYGLSLSARSEYQSRVHYFNQEFGPAEGNPTMKFAVYQFGLQWKSKWWYLGGGGQVTDMIGLINEPAPTVYYCGVGLVGPLPPTPAFVTQDYSSSGYYFQLGFTPRITALSSAVCEFNWYADFTGIEGYYPTKVAMPGMRLGVQRRFVNN